MVKGVFKPTYNWGAGPYCRVNKPFVDDFPALSPWP